MYVLPFWNIGTAGINNFLSNLWEFSGMLRYEYMTGNTKKITINKYYLLNINHYIN